MKLSMASDYNEHSKSQSSLWKWTEQKLGLFSTALGTPREAALSGDSDARAFCVLELGCATGGNSLDPLACIAKHVLPTDGARLEIILADRPENHWERLESTVTPEAILKKLPNELQEQTSASSISVATHRGTFYDPCAKEPESIDFSFSFAASHWMVPPPAGSPRVGGPCLFPTCPTDHLDSIGRYVWQRLAQDQLARFVECRRRELKLGGRFCASFCCLEEHRGSTPWSRIGTLVREQAQLRLERTMPSDGMDPSQAVLPIAFRTRHELLDAFGEGWRVLRCEYVLAQDPAVRKRTKALAFGRESSPELYLQSMMDAWASACLPGLVAASVQPEAGAGAHSSAHAFWEACCADVVQSLLAEEVERQADGDEDDYGPALHERYHLGIPSYLVLAEKIPLDDYGFAAAVNAATSGDEASDGGYNLPVVCPPCPP